MSKFTKLAPVNVDGMPAPNHMVALDLAPSLQPDTDYVGRQYPLLSIMLPENPDSGVPERLAFVAKPYKLAHWAERDFTTPPTWMDPELFVRQLRAKPEIAELADKIAQGGDMSKVKKLEPLLVDAFEALYLPYLVQQFKLVLPLLARWLVANAAIQQTGSKTKRKKPNGSDDDV